MDVAGEFVFDTPEHYTATITTASSMIGRQLQAGAHDHRGTTRGRVPVSRMSALIAVLGLSCRCA